VTICELKIAGLEQPVTASFGVAVYPDEAGDPEELMRIADRALYRAKAHGRNRVEVAVVDGASAAAPAAEDNCLRDE
jgi:diguanylate cyclase (GGDEF)-like protein